MCGYVGKIKFVLVMTFPFTDSEISVNIFSFMLAAVHSEH